MDRYEEALAKARVEYEKARKQGYAWLMNLLEGMFPELKESEDEGIRRHLIDIVETYWGTTNDPGKAADLAWLERQKESTWTEEDESFRKHSLPRILNPKGWTMEQIEADRKRSNSLLNAKRISGSKSMSGYRNKMFVRADLMPHQIRITNVRVERLQDISDENCLKEGIYLDETAPSCYQPFYTFKESQEHGTPIGYRTARESFAAIIDKVSGKGTWKSNPWVFVYEFELMN